MADYAGDYVEDYDNLNIKFTTKNSSGVPTTLSGSPVISVYKSNSAAQSTSGVTLSVDFDGIVGLNNVNIDLSAHPFYETGEDYSAVITTGTVGGDSRVGEVVGSLSIENRSSPSVATIVSGVWDEVLTSGSYNIVNSAGRRIRELEVGTVLHAGSTQSGSTSSVVVIANSASNQDDFFLHQLFIIDGESRLCVAYDGASRSLTVDKPLLNGAPSNNTPYEISTIGPVFAAAMRFGYTNDTVFINTITGQSGAVHEINGIQDNPSDNIADATTVAAAHSPPIEKFDFAPGSTVTPTQTYSNWQWLGRAATINFNNQQYPNNTFERHFYTGVISASTASQYRMLVGQVTAAGMTTPLEAIHSGITYLGNVTFNATGDFNSILGRSDGQTFDMNAGISTGSAIFSSHTGNIVIDNLTGSQVVEFYGKGQVTLTASCTGGSVIHGGDVLVINNGSSTVSGLTIESISTDIAGLNDITVAEILESALTENYAADGAAPTLTQAILLALQHLSESSVIGTTKTVRELDGSTTAATFTLNDATNPTSITRST